MSRKVSSQKAKASQILNEELGFRVWHGEVGAMPNAHTHSEIEINLVSRGWISYFLSGRFQRVEAGQLSVFWAGAPHQVLEVAPQTRALWVTLPLSWFMQWRLDDDFTQRLLSGELLMQAPIETTNIEYSMFENVLSDEALLRRWLDDYDVKSNETQRIVLLELEARLRRLARHVKTQDSVNERVLRGNTHGNAVANGDATSRQVEKLASYLSLHYQNDLSIEDAVRAVGLHPKYAMQLFKNGCGITLGNYLQKLRLSHAQRLLLSTDWPIERIAEESGFGSVSRFHAVFKTQTGETPRAFRQRHEV